VWHLLRLYSRNKNDGSLDTFKENTEVLYGTLLTPTLSHTALEILGLSKPSGYLHGH